MVKQPAQSHTVKKPGRKEKEHCSHPHQAPCLGIAPVEKLTTFQNLWTPQRHPKAPYNHSLILQFPESRLAGKRAMREPHVPMDDLRSS